MYLTFHIRVHCTENEIFHKDFCSKCDQICRFVRFGHIYSFTEEILNGKLHFLCSGCTLIWYDNKEKYLHKIPIFTFTNIFPQAYLIWGPDLDVPKIGIPLSKIPPAAIVYIYIKHFILYGLLGTVSPIMDPLHFALSPTLCFLYSLSWIKSN